MNFSVTFTSAWNSGAPAGATDCVNRALQWLGSQLLDNITVPYTIDWQSIAGGAATTWVAAPQIAWATFFTELSALSKTANDAQSLLFLSSTPPTGFSGGVVVSGPLYQVLTGSSSFNVSNQTVFNSGLSWGTNGAPGVSYGVSGFDMFGITMHEVSEALGRASNGNGIGILNLWRYASSGTRAATDNSTSGYFSLDNGATVLGTWPDNSGGDPFDWASGQGPVPNDACLQSAVGNTMQPFSVVDWTLMDIMGWHLNDRKATPGVTFGWPLLGAAAAVMRNPSLTRRKLLRP